MEWVKYLFGTGEHLAWFQMCFRGILVSLITLFMLRLAGQRTFGNKSAIDNIVVIILGALLSRAIVGVSPFIPIIAAAFVIVLVHRLLAWLCLRNETLERIIDGEKKCIYKDGAINRENMRKTLISDEDISEGIRLQINKNSFEEVKEIYIEKCGIITVIKK